MAGKLGRRRLSTTSFSENVVLAGTSYQMLEVQSFRSTEGLTSFNKDNSTIFSNDKKKKYNEAFCGVYFLRIGKKIEVESRTRIRSRPQI